MRRTGKDDIGIRWSLGIFANNLAQFGLHVCLQGRTDVDLFSADLIPHRFSYLVVTDTQYTPLLRVWLMRV